jgi:hypothetical protein
MLGGVPNVLRKDNQIHPLIRHLMSPLPMVVWVTEVVDLWRYHHIRHWVPFLIIGGSKWEQMRLP